MEEIHHVSFGTESFSFFFDRKEHFGYFDETCKYILCTLS